MCVRGYGVAVRTGGEIFDHELKGAVKVKAFVNTVVAVVVVVVCVHVCVCACVCVCVCVREREREREN